MLSRPISASYLERKLRAIVSVQGSNPLPDLEDIHGLLILENDRIEWYLSGGELIGTILKTSSAGAGNLSYVAIVNPQGSGNICIVEQILCLQDGEIREAVPANVAAAAPFLPGEVSSGSVFPRDFRIPSAGVFPVRFSEGNNLAPPFSGPIGLAASRIPKICSYLIAEDTALVVQHTALNAAVTVEFIFRVRPIEGTFEIK